MLPLFYVQKATKSSKEASQSVEPVGPGIASLFDYSAYGKFVSLIGGADSYRPRERGLPWLMKFIEEIYDSRYAKDTAELKEGETEGDNSGSAPSPFPGFVVDFVSKRYGLRSLVDQSCWDLLYNLHKLRKEHLEVEVFARFVEEMYDPDDLLFFLYVRSVVQKELSYSFRARWSEMGRNAAPSSSSAASSSASLQLSFRDCSLVSRVVFGSESDPLFRTFMTMIERNMQGKKTTKADNRKIDVGNFLHLAVVEYHETRPQEDGADNTDDRLFREAAAAYDDGLRSGAIAAPDTSSAGGDVGAGVRPSPALLEALGEAMHRANETYLDKAISFAGTLPKEVQAQIRTEVQAQLESKVDNVLAAVITVSQNGSGSSSGNGEIDALGQRFSAFIASSPSEDSIAGFCEDVLASGEIKKTIEPLVNLLVQYASSRLKEASGTK